MNVVLSRIDERLIHGQVMTAWVKKCWVKKIILVDDELATDEFMKDVLAMSAPSGVKVETRTVDETFAVLGSDDSTENTMLLFKELKFAYLLYQAGYKFNELNIGNIGSNAVRKPITKQVYISEEEKEYCRQMNKDGIYVYIQKLPQDSQVDVMTKI